MPEELVQHVRYPEDLFKLQRDILTRYHVQDPGNFYSQNDRWQVPADPTQDTEEAQPPYYILAKRPGDQRASFQLTSALNAFNRDNLSSFISASSDPGTYGQIQVLRLPGNTPFKGPRQVQQSFNTNDETAQDLNLFRGSDSQPVFGNLLTLPIGEDGLLYVQPLYVEGTGQNPFPLLRKVLVNFGESVGYADTLQEALDQVFGPGAGDSATDGDETPPADDGTTTPTTPASPPAGGDTPASPEMDQAASDISAAIQALKTAQQNGDFEGQGRALADLEAAVEAYQAAQREAGASTAPASASPTG
jgi:uncharacterized protein